jgi:hypothetical protein
LGHAENAARGPSENNTESFKEAAKKIGADESGKALERAFGTIVPPKEGPTEGAQARRLRLRHSGLRRV